MTLNSHNKTLKQKLEYHYKAYNKHSFSPDPIEYPQQYDNYHDIEVSAFISALFAYGRVEQIEIILGEIFSRMNNSPYDFIINSKENLIEKSFTGIKYRFYTERDIISLLKILKIVYSNYGTLKYLFLEYYFEEERNLKNSISFFSKNMKNLCNKNGGISKGLKFMFPDPFTGSACKRMNLFLRWVVRNDNVDLGIWNEIPTQKLIIPVDTHIFEIARKLKLTRRKIVSWKMAEEITEKLKQYSPNDPVKYDFALCHIGMRNHNL